VDIGPRTRIRSVWPRDRGGDGWPPTAENCVASIDQRRHGESNEWTVQDYRPIGIFVLFPILVRRMQLFIGQGVLGEVPIDLREVVDAFPGHRIFSVNDRTFLEWDRDRSEWNPVAYNDIIGM